MRLWICHTPPLLVALQIGTTLQGHNTGLHECFSYSCCITNYPRTIIITQCLSQGSGVQIGHNRDGSSLLIMSGAGRVNHLKACSFTWPAVDAGCWLGAIGRTPTCGLEFLIIWQLNSKGKYLEKEEEVGSDTYCLYNLGLKVPCFFHCILLIKVAIKKNWPISKGGNVGPHFSMESVPHHSMWTRIYIDMAIFEKYSPPQCAMPPLQKNKNKNIETLRLIEPRKIYPRKIINRKKLCLKILCAFLYWSSHPINMD